MLPSCVLFKAMAKAFDALEKQAHGAVTVYASLETPYLQGMTDNMRQSWFESE